MQNYYDIKINYSYLRAAKINLYDDHSFPLKVLIGNKMRISKALQSTLISYRDVVDEMKTNESTITVHYRWY